MERPRVACERSYNPFFCAMHHYLDRCGSRDPKMMLRRFEITSRSVDFKGLWIAPSNYSRRMLALRGIPESRIRFAPNPGPEQGQDAPAGSVDARSGHFLFIGRLVPNKGCDIAIRAVATSPGLALQVVGDGPERGRLEALSRELGIADRILFEGWLPREEVDRKLSGCLALVVPSLWPEPFGLVALEAFSKQVPVIASRAGGLVDIVQSGHNGLLVDPGSIEQLSKAMLQLAGSPSTAAELGRAGSRTLRESFSLATHLDSLEELYREAALVPAAGRGSSR